MLSDLTPARQGDQLTGLGLPGRAVHRRGGAVARAWSDPRLAEIAWLARDNSDLVRALSRSCTRDF